ncbi:MAG: hypothetical protein P4L59_21470 [Desulfosporosinus sp.]|nr:hypothetical protein [Desulfosporosinus sp.]
MLMIIKEVIVLAYLSRTTITPLLLTYESESMYLHIDSQGCALFGGGSSEPVYQIQEPLLLAHGIMTDPETVHLVVLKTNGELCYTLISGPSMPLTTLIAKLDIRATTYRRLFLFPQGKLIHIFFAYSHQAIRNLWHIEHRFWNGSSWHSAHMGEVVNQQEPLYHVNLDSQGNLHLLTITCQGRHSLLFTNRFNGTFHLWGSPAETLKISGEVVDMASLMTSDNVHHLFWVVKNSGGQFEVRWAQQTDAHELTSTWHPSPAPIKTFPSPWKSIGAVEKNGVLWLLAHTGEEILMHNDGKGWKLISSHTPFYLPLQWVHKGKKNFHQTYWLEDQAERRAPAYYLELGIAAKKQVNPLPASSQTPLPTPPPVPAFYPELSSPTSDPVQSVSITENKSNSLNSSEVIEPVEVIQPHSLQEHAEFEHLVSTVAQLEQDNAELQRLITTVAYLEAENTKLQLIAPTVAHLEQENSELQRLITTVAYLEAENTKLQLIAPTVAQLEQGNSELQRLISTVAYLEAENTKLQLIAPTVAQLEQGNSELQRLITTVAYLEEENTKLQLIAPTVALLEQNNAELQRLISTVAHIEQENEDMSLLLRNVLSRFNEVVEDMSNNAHQVNQESAIPALAEIHFNELEPVKDAMSNLEKETQSLSQVLRVMLVKQEESDSSLEKLKTLLSQLQTSKEEVKNKGGFWNKWIT